MKKTSVSVFSCLYCLLQLPPSTVINCVLVESNRNMEKQGDKMGQWSLAGNWHEFYTAACLV